METDRIDVADAERLAAALQAVESQLADLQTVGARNDSEVRAELQVKSREAAQLQAELAAVKARLASPRRAAAAGGGGGKSPRSPPAPPQDPSVAVVSAEFQAVLRGLGLSQVGVLTNSPTALLSGPDLHLLSLDDDSLRVLVAVGARHYWSHRR